MVFPVVRYRCENWTIKKAEHQKNWCFQTVVLEKTLKNPMDSKEIKPVNLKANKPWIVVGKTDAEAEAPVFWSSDANSRLIGKAPDAGKDWGQKEKRASEDEMLDVWHNRPEFEQTSRKWRTGMEAWCATVHWITKSWIWLSDWITTTIQIIFLIELP